ncbi:membrane-bound lytic murein transglycosylase MltF [Halomonadaceae bacterium KBTZ08]
MHSSQTKCPGIHPGLAASLAVPVILVLLLTACSQPTTLDRINQEGVLHVVMPPASTVYYEEKGEPSGFEYELVQRFADSLGVELRVEVVDNLPELYQRLDEHHTHIAAAGLPLTPALRRRYRHGPVYDRSRPVVVYNASVERPREPAALTKLDLAVRAGSAAEQQLERIQETLPELSWTAKNRQDPTELLHRVDKGELDATVVDSRELDNNRVFFANIREGFALSNPRPVGWLFPPSGDGSLMQAARDYFRSARSDDTLAQLQERFFGHLEHLDYVGAQTFTRHLKNRLPQYRDTFIAAAHAHELDWRLLAAIGYQESHWEPHAVSPTGVRGLMMLTQDTAAHVGVTNRVDPDASIWGGARFFRRLHDRIPDSITEPDRTWFALAAYNVGYGHLQDARRLARQDNQDPDRWLDVKEYLPLLAQRQYYTQTRYGYARGYEPVLYTQNIRRYYDVLKWMFPEEDAAMAFTENGIESPLEDTEGQSSKPRSTLDASSAEQRQSLRPASPLF